MPNALLSVSNKSGLVDLGRSLVQRGFNLISTGGTARALAEAGIDVKQVSEVTGMPEMMDGRVKTLHPRIHGGILARRGNPRDIESAALHGIALIDLVVVNLYPFAQAASDPNVVAEGLIEEIDIGGPSLVRAAAKNFADVLVVVDPSDYPNVISELDRPDGPSLEFRLALARKAFAHTAEYDRTIAREMTNLKASGGRILRNVAPEEELPHAMTVELTKLRNLRYGENPHQAAAWYRSHGAASIDVLQGKELSFTNLLDLDAAARIVSEFEEPAAAVIKHTNPCGAAIGGSAVEAYVRAREADPVSAYGGIVGLNRAIDEEVAREIASTFIEAVVAPSITEKAREVLSGRKNLRVVIWPGPAVPGGAASPWEGRTIFCGVLVQRRDSAGEMRQGLASGVSTPSLRVVSSRQPTAAEWEALSFAWRIVAHVKSNAVIFTNARRTLAIGAGQMSRVDAVNVALLKAGGVPGGPPPETLAGSVAASDAYFPFRDGLDAVARAGATAVIQPGGSVRDQEVIAAADEQGLAMVFTGVRHFRH